jgi:hypothetical protein
MISYLFIVSAQFVFQNDSPNLLDLIRFCFRADWLQIDDFLNARLEKNMVTTANSLLEPRYFKSLTNSEKEMFASDLPLNIVAINLSDSGIVF